MCGRCACARNREAIQKACAFRPRGGSVVATPTWISPNTQTCYPSYNVSPQTNSPVLISGQHGHVKTWLKGKDSDSLIESRERVIQAMKWGLVPGWHKGDSAQSFPTLLNNCRYDGMFEKPSFRNAIAKRQRCVVLADGFYEWQRDKPKVKKAFFIYPPSNCTEETKVLLDNEGDAVDESYHRMLTMAGYFDIWRSDMAEHEVLYTYTIITVDASERFSPIHHRMPALLETQEAIECWLDPLIPTQQAVRSIASVGGEEVDGLLWHPVSSYVNNVRNNSPQCIVKADHSTVKADSKGSQSLLKWFKKAPSGGSNEDNISTDMPPAKKIKTEL